MTPATPHSTDGDAAHSTGGGPGDRPNAAERTEAAVWDERYSDAERVWSGEPNGTLVTEVLQMRPGTVLDVGCGEGADAVWLAQQGWDVTALDVSGVALARARQAAIDAGVDVGWLHSGLIEARLPDGGFDLVSAQYPALTRTPGNDAERALTAAVAPGGTVMFVHHAAFDSRVDHVHSGVTHRGDGPGVDPQDYIGTADIVALLGDDWQIDTHEVRARDVRNGAGAHHTDDVVVLARRLT